MQRSSLQEHPAPLAVCRNMIAIASGKGGVGKTWLSATLCHALARRGRKVLLFDGDLGLANVDIQLGLAPERDLGGALAGHYDLKAAITEYAEGPFDVIAGRSGSGGLAVLPAQKLAALTRALMDLAPDYHHVIVDLGAGIERTVRYLAARAATCLVITNDEPTSLTDAYAFIKLSLLHDPRADLRVVINMASSAAEGERTYGTLRKACSSFLKATPPLAGVIPRDKSVKDAIRGQTGLLTRHPNCQAALGIERLAGRLLE